MFDHRRNHCTWTPTLSFRLQSAGTRSTGLQLATSTAATSWLYGFARYGLPVVCTCTCMRRRPAPRASVVLQPHLPGTYHHADVRVTTCRCAVWRIRAHGSGCNELVTPSVANAFVSACLAIADDKVMRISVQEAAPKTCCAWMAYFTQKCLLEDACCVLYLYGAGTMSCWPPHWIIFIRFTVLHIYLATDCLPYALRFGSLLLLLQHCAIHYYNSAFSCDCSLPAVLAQHL